MYRNYDGNKSTFGDTSVAATAPNPDNVVGLRRAAVGRRRADRHGRSARVSSGSTPATINLANFTHGGTAQVWQLTSANTITRLADVTRQRQQLRRDAAGAEHHALRGPRQRDRDTAAAADERAHYPGAVRRRESSEVLRPLGCSRRRALDQTGDRYEEQATPPGPSRRSRSRWRLAVPRPSPPRRRARQPSA